MCASGFSRHPLKIAGKSTQLVDGGSLSSIWGFDVVQSKTEKPEWRGNLTKFEG
jgi:hypothetical protein